MALDGILLNLAKKEILDCAQFGRVEKIHQPSREELVIHLRTKSGAKKLLLSVRANSPRIHFTQHAPENPATPPMFCMLMRKRLVNASLIDIRQSELDRVLYIDFDATNEKGVSAAALNFPHFAKYTTKKQACQFMTRLSTKVEENYGVLGLVVRVAEVLAAKK